MDTEIDRLLRDSDPVVLLQEDLAPTVGILASEIAGRNTAAHSIRRRVAISTVSVASAAAAIAIGVTTLGHGGQTELPAAGAGSYAAQLKLVAAEAPADLSLPAGVTLNDAATAVLHKITVDPGYKSEPGLRTVADVYRMYAKCQAWVFKPAMGSTVDGVTVTPTNPTPGGGATLINSSGVDFSPIGPEWVKVQCKDGLAVPPKSNK